MSHYICKGDECKTIDEKPSICLEPSCAHRYKLLEECNCPHREAHYGGPTDAHPAGAKKGGLSAVHFGAALGIISAVFVGLLGLASYTTGGAWGGEMIRVLGTFYLGYAPTPLGSAAGALWALIDGAIGGYLIAVLYNALQRHR